MTVPEQATRYAALVALKDAVVGELSKASAELREGLWQQGLTKGTVTTPLGPITLRESKGGTSVVITDEDALIGWCEEFSPESIERVVRVRPNDRAVILSQRFAAVAGDVLDTVTGQVVEFAKVETTPASAPTPSYGASERQREVKAIAADVAQHRLSLLTDLIATRVHMLEPPDYDKQEGE